MIVVFGSINVDLVARVVRLPRPGETVPGISFAALPGGKGANQALAARMAGASVAMAGATGTDAFASIALGGLVAAGIDLDAVERVGAPTGTALIHVDAAGENSITVVAGANALASATTIRDALLGPGSTLLVQFEVPVAATVAAAVRARTLGARVVLNAAPAQHLPPVLLTALDVLIVNEIEAAALGSAFAAAATPEEFAIAIHRRHGCTAIVTLGPDGALAAADGMLHVVPAPSIEVVDTTGAGDAFAGALAAALDRGAPMPRALAEGVAAGSLACNAAGAQSALPLAAAIGRLANAVELTIVSRRLD